jgi:hypothetical protein
VFLLGYTGDTVPKDPLFENMPGNLSEGLDDSPPVFSELFGRESGERFIRRYDHLMLGWQRGPCLVVVKASHNTFDDTEYPR